ncbi:MAG: polymerase subunit gamma/tau [Burkholderiales bacterium]|jgi:DNA polymerase-3 subunit gamma/tau|nr:polymerase subunit gamma/tau [Burkholderiales bacterium]
MANTVLARKWRPKKFADLIGQQTAVTVLNNILKNHRMHHAYLLTGTRGVGKTTIARIIARALNCTDLQINEPCGACKNCVDIDKGNFVDVIEIDAASNTGVDNIRELIDNAGYAPTMGKYKVYIIDEVHMLSKSAFNAMLKTLEEPPLHAVFILATTDLQKVPVTILSRCLQLKLRNLLPPEIATHLASILKQENISFENEALNVIAHTAYGSMRDALSITDQAIAYTNNIINLADIKTMLGITDDEFIYTLLDTINEQNSSKLTVIATDIYNQGCDLENVLLKLNQILCNISLVQLGGLDEERLKFYANCFSINDVQLYFEITNLGLEQIVKGNNKFQVFIMTLLRIAAFTIGSNNDKQAIINSRNQAPAPNLAITEETATPKFESNLVQPATLISNTPIIPPFVLDTKNSSPVQATITITESFCPQVKQFDGDWIALIEELENKLDKAIHPVLANAKFNSYANKQFNLIVDNKYESAVNASLIHNISKIFSEYFGYTVTFDLQFSENVGATLKEKRNTEKEEKQKIAEEAIKNDANLIKMQQLFSATIVPNSIKPI